MLKQISPAQIIRPPMLQFLSSWYTLSTFTIFPNGSRQSPKTRFLRPEIIHSQFPNILSKDTKQHSFLSVSTPLLCQMFRISYKKIPLFCSPQGLSETKRFPSRTCGGRYSETLAGLQTRDIQLPRGLGFIQPPY